MVLIIVLAVAVVLVGGFLIIYNRLVRRRNRVDNAWAQVDVQLRRRYDLIPNLVEAVKGYAAHEQETFEAVVAARTTAQEATSVADQAEAEGMLGSMLRRLFALAEQYPELRASENFQDLQRQLGETEDRIAVARQIYNDTVLTYNNTVQTVPSNLVAAIARFRTREFFEVEDDARGVPRVAF
jgi:LemA protein